MSLPKSAAVESCNVVSSTLKAYGIPVRRFVPALDQYHRRAWLIPRVQALDWSP